MLTGGALAVVVLSDDEPGLAGLLPALGQLRDGVLAAVQVVGGVDLARLGVDGGVERVGADVGQVALVLEPGTGGRNGVGRALASNLDKHAEAGQVGLGERVEGLEQGEALRRGRNGDLDVGVGGLRQDLEDLLALDEGSLGTLQTLGGGELELLARGGRQRVGDRVESGGAGEGHGGHDLGRGQEVHGVRVAVVTAAEVAVVRRQNGIGGSLLHVILALPLADAGTAGVGKDNAASLVESLEGTVTLKSGTNLLTAGGDVEIGSRLETSLLGGLEHALDAGHVLVGAVGAAANEAGRQLLGPVLGLDGLLELGQGGGKVRGERAVDVGLKLGEVDLDQLVVLSALVGLESEVSILGGAGAGEGLKVHSVLSGLLAAGGLEVAGRGLGVGEDGGGGTNLSYESYQYVLQDNMRTTNLPPMLQMVAIPVRLRVSTPGPEYSTM